jgi:hypothetical protein
MMGKMKDLGGAFGGMEGLGGLGNMGDMFKTMMGNMNMPKGARFDTTKMEQMQKTTTLKERLKARALAKKQQEVVQKLEEEALRIRKEREYNEYMAANPNIIDELINEPVREKDPNVLSASQKKRAKKKAKKQAQKEKVQEAT